MSIKERTPEQLARYATRARERYYYIPPGTDVFSASDAQEFIIAFANLTKWDKKQIAIQIAALPDAVLEAASSNIRTISHNITTYRTNRKQRTKENEILEKLNLSDGA
jgi:hypothetical protein